MGQNRDVVAELQAILDDPTRPERQKKILRSFIANDIDLWLELIKQIGDEREGRR